MVWNDQADAKLLAAILNTAKPKLDFDAIAKYMGDDCSGCAVQNRIRRLKGKAKGDDQDGATSTSPIPCKRKKDKRFVKQESGLLKKVKIKEENGNEDGHGHK